MSKRRSPLILLLLSIATALLTAACNSSTPTSDAIGEPTAPLREEVSAADSIDEEEWDNWLAAYNEAERAEAAERDDRAPTTAKAEARTTAPAPRDARDIAPKPHSGSKAVPNGQKIYVSTFGAQGEVWGYVVMNGNSGTGTIHDGEENTLAIRVTRHGNELFATDQNSRQYVFKI